MKVADPKFAIPLVYVSGAVTSLIALAVVYALTLFLDFNLLGFYI